MADAILSYSGVSYTYRGDWLQKVQALKRVDLTVPAGCAFGFLGANGAGKSTSIKLACGLLHGHRGAIRLLGGELTGTDADCRWRARLGYLPEQPYFYENQEVGEYLAWLARLSGMDPAAIPAACDRVYQLLDLGDLRHRPLRSFSKGMRQRFGLAQAIVHRPDLLILDEPFSGLDPLWRARFREVMAHERARGATLFFSSHILSDVEDLCDRYAVIDHGEVLEQGRIADLLGQAPLALTGSGPAPAGAAALPDGTWRLEFPEERRSEVLASVPASAILRLERQRIALEDWFVQRVQGTHGAGRPVASPAMPVGGGKWEVGGAHAPGGAVGGGKWEVGGARAPQGAPSADPEAKPAAPPTSHLPPPTGDGGDAGIAGIATIASATAREAVRSRAFLGLLLLFLLGAGASRIAGWVSATDGHNVATNLVLTLQAVIGVLVAVATGTALVQSEIVNRTLYTVLSRPVPRWRFVVGKYVGLAAALLAGQVAMAAIGLGWLWLTGAPVHRWLAVAGLLTGVEVLVMAAVALCWTALSSPLLAAALSLATWFLGHAVAGLPNLMWHLTGMKQALAIGCAGLVPNLGHFAYRDRAANGDPLAWGDLGTAIAYGALWIVLLVTVTVAVVRRRQL